MNNQEKVKVLLDGTNVGNKEQWTQMLSAWVAGKVEALRYFQLSDMRYNDRNTFTERVSITVLQLCLIWTPAQILEHIIEFQRWI